MAMPIMREVGNQKNDVRPRDIQNINPSRSPYPFDLWSSSLIVFRRHHFILSFNPTVRNSWMRVKFGLMLIHRRALSVRVLDWGARHTKKKKDAHMCCSYKGAHLTISLCVCIQVRTVRTILMCGLPYYLGQLAHL